MLETNFKEVIALRSKSLLRQHVQIHTGQTYAAQESTHIFFCWKMQIPSFLFLLHVQIKIARSINYLFRYLAQLSRINSFWHSQGQNKQRAFHRVFSLRSDKRRLSFFRLTPSVTVRTEENSLLSDVF